MLLHGTKKPELTMMNDVVWINCFTRKESCLEAYYRLELVGCKFIASLEQVF